MCEGFQNSEKRDADHRRVEERERERERERESIDCILLLRCLEIFCLSGTQYS